MTLNLESKKLGRRDDVTFFSCHLFACTLGVTKMTSDFGGHRPEV